MFFVFFMCKLRLEIWKHWAVSPTGWDLLVRLVGISVSTGPTASVFKRDEKRMDAETLLSFYQTTWCHISEDYECFENVWTCFAYVCSEVFRCFCQSLQASVMYNFIVMLHLFLPHSFPFIIYNNPVIRRCVVLVPESVVKPAVRQFTYNWMTSPSL
jgi:hypothetical protein